MSIDNNPILVVDDNLVNLKLIQILLTKQGYHVRTAADIQNAQNALEMYRPLLVLLDLHLPESDGLTFLRQLKADPSTASIPVVVLTASLAVDREQEAWKAGCDGFIRKPIESRTFVDALRPYLEQTQGKGAQVN